MAVIESTVDRNSAQFAARADAMRELVADLRQRLQEVSAGGGPAARERHVARGNCFRESASTCCSIPERPF